jgi:glucose/arabinose dehydrogenase
MGDGQRSVAALARGRWNGEALVGTEDVFVGAGTPSRFTFAPDGTIFMTMNGPGPQDPATIGGKILRINDDGSAPDDNPFVGMEGYAAEVYSLGHRTTLGIAIHPPTGDVWANENGPNGGDEINIIRPGLNYGWPVVSYGRNYSGPWQAETPDHTGYEGPVVYWMPSIAISGMAF